MTLRRSANASSVYLVDSGRGKEAKSPMRIPKATTILASSPRKEHYVSFCVQGKAEMRYMPLWSWEDVCSARFWLSQGQVESESDVRQRYDEIGGVVRYIFGSINAYKIFITQRQMFCRQSPDFSAAIVATLHNELSDSVHQTPTTENFHKVFGLVPSDDFVEFSYVVLGKPSLENAFLDTVLTCYRSIVVKSTTHMNGVKFKRVVKNMVSLGAYFKARRLSDAVSSRVDSLISLPLGSHTQLFATGPLALGGSRLEEAVARRTGSVILNPTVSNFLAVDALLLGVRELASCDGGSPNSKDMLKKGVERSIDALVGLQVTITSFSTPNGHTISSHGLNKDVIEKLRSNGAGRPSIRVMFVVPSDHYESAVMQNVVVVVRNEESLSKPKQNRPSTKRKTIKQKDYSKDESRLFDVEQWVVDCMLCGTSGRVACDCNAAVLRKK